MIEEVLRERISAGENRWTAFKTDFTSVSAVLPAVIAFANGVFEGWIIFGVTGTAEAGAAEIVGVPDPERLQAQLENLCLQHCAPPLTPKIETVETARGAVVVLRVYGNDNAKPYRQKELEAYWVRQNGRNELVTADEALAFVEQQHRVFSPLLREIHITGFRSIFDSSIELKQLNIIIGPNASGKSNLFKALRFVHDLASEGIGKGHQEMARHLFWYGTSDEIEPQFTFDLTMAVPGQQGRFAPRYELAIKQARDRLIIDRERLMLRLHSIGPEIAFIDRQAGKVERYAEHPNSDPENQHPRYLPVQGKLPLRTAALATYGRETTFPPLENLYRFIQGWRFLQVDPRAARESVIPESIGEEIPALQNNAGNLSAFLYALKHNETTNDLFEEIQERLHSAIRAAQSLTTTLRASVTGGTGKAEIAFNETFFPGRAIPAESMSDGTLCLLSTLAVLIGDPGAALICLEEPDRGLHPHLMLWLADAIRSVVDLEPESDDQEFRRPQIVITTHSPDFMDCFDLRAEASYLQVFIARRDEEGKTTFEPVTAEEFAPWLDEYRLGDLTRKNILDQGVF